jgi:hypothetical protein
MPLPGDAEVKPFEKCGGTGNVITLLVDRSRRAVRTQPRIRGIFLVSSERMVGGLSVLSSRTNDGVPVA